MSSAPRKIAVTGCNGLVGTRVVLLALVRGYYVVGIDVKPLGGALKEQLSSLDEGTRSKLTFMQADLQDYNEMLKALEGCYGAIHLAATLPHLVADCHNSNVVMSYNFLRAAAEHNITRVAQASSVNVTNLVFAKECHFDYFPLDEEHQLNADEHYGLAKIICETQAQSIVRRYPFMRIASLRLHHVTPSRELRDTDDEDRHRTDLWGYVQQDSAADAFLLAMEEDNGTGWLSGSEAFFICAPRTTSNALTSDLRDRFWPDVPLRQHAAKPSFTDVTGKSAGFYNCRKAAEILGWNHRDDIEEVDKVVEQKH